jgi:membrane-associated protease RseP (regulator of RpoE activity)
MSVEEPHPYAPQGRGESAPLDPGDGASADDGALEDAPLPPVRWKVNLALFLATLVSVFFTGASYEGKLPTGAGLLEMVKALPSGWTYAVPLMAILLTHEFGHYIAARLHRVDASLPFFIPLPLLSPFGTMGAVISMRGQIRSRNALLDIGASGPLAGLVVAIPTLIIGLAHSQVLPLPEHGAQEGQSLLYLLLKRIILGHIPEGHDVFLNATAFAGWSGIFVTALNLLTVAQLDGGHVAYALFGKRQDRYSRILHASLLGMFGLNLLLFVLPVLTRSGWEGGELAQAVGNSVFWLVWFVVLRAIMRVSGREHPPTEPGELSPIRKGVAVVTLVLFVLLFMPTPWKNY